MTRKEQLEARCTSLFSGEKTTKAKLSVLEDAFWQSNDKNYCDTMSSRLSSGYEGPSTDYWQEACRLKNEVSELIGIYKSELEGEKLSVK